MNGGMAFEAMPENEVTCKPYGSKGSINPDENLRYLPDCPICKYGTAEKDQFCDDCKLRFVFEIESGDIVVQHWNKNYYRIRTDCDGKIVQRKQIYDTEYSILKPK